MSTCDQLSLFDIADFEPQPAVELISTETLLSKFDAVIIENVSLITEEDTRVCESYQRDFEESVQTVQRYLKYYEENSCNNQYLRSSSFIKREEEQLSNIVNRFITDIFNHFRKSYSVTVEQSKMVNKYDYKVTYQEIVDEIIIQLDGMNFKERAAEEIRNNIRELIYRPQERVKVKSNSVRISEFLFFDFDLSQPQNRRWEHLKNLFHGIEYFETESTCPRDALKEFYYGSSYRSDWFDEFTFESMSKFKSFKCFKNGSIQLKFASSELAVQFAKEYLKYTN